MKKIEIEISDVIYKYIEKYAKRRDLTIENFINVSIGDFLNKEIDQ